MTAQPLDPIAFVAAHGVVLQAARGPVPTLAHAVAGEPVRGSWWAHPAAHAIYHALGVARSSPDVLACRLIAGKVTLVHRRLWPAFVCLADAGLLAPGRIAAVREEHTTAGRHESVEIPLHDWVPPDVAAAARSLTTEEAVAALGPAAAPILRPAKR